MNKHLYNYTRYSHSMISSLLNLVTKLYAIDDKPMTDKKALALYKDAVNAFESKSEHLLGGMTNYHLMDSQMINVSSLKSKAFSTFYILNMKFQYCQN